MSSIGFSTLSVIPSARGFGSALSGQVNPQLGAAGTSGGQAFSKNLKKVVVGAGLVIAAGLGMVLKTGFGEAMDASAGMAQLAAGIKSTGNAANVSVKGMNELAGAIQGYSGQTDDSIVKSQQLLLTFTKIVNGVGKGNDIFDRATVATANMAAKMGGDASASAIQLGKALNDPIKGVSALGRMGVQFSDSQKDAIKSMIALGDTAGAQKVILTELETQFGGAAKAAGDSLPGQLAKGKRAFEDMSQTVVEVILPIVAPAIAGIAENLKKATPSIISFAKAFSDDLKTAIDFVAPPIQAFIGFLKEHSWLAKAAGVAIVGLALGVGVYNLAQGIATIATKAWAVAQGIATGATAVWTAGQWLLNAALTANPIGLIIVAVAALVAGIILIATKTTWFQTLWTTTWNVISSAATGATNWIIEKFNSVISFFTGLPSRITGALGSLGTLLYSAGSAIISGLFSGITDKFNSVKSFISGIGSWIAKNKGPLDYDRQLLVPHGNAIMTGLNEGLTTGFVGVQANLSSMASRVASQWASINNFGNGADARFDRATFKTPVIGSLDMSSQVTRQLAVAEATKSAAAALNVGNGADARFDQATSKDIAALADRIDAAFGSQARKLQMMSRTN